MLDDTASLFAPSTNGQTARRIYSNLFYTSFYLNSSITKKELMELLSPSAVAERFLSAINFIPGYSKHKQSFLLR